uniref:RNA-directed RNA polymerase n=1 Tax=Beihai levi-like virus 10 TaxID=1922395 RepID=A0A1L3KI78_9VIRU|nr:hypothetical protein [Beihai levi-like virus 10]
MKNSLEKVCLGVVQSLLLRDFAATYPNLTESFSKDYTRISEILRTRGLPSLMDDLPKLDKALLAGLEHGRLSYDGPFSRLVSRSVRVPRLLSGLWLRVFDNSGCLLESPDQTAIAYIRQLSSCFKKLKMKCTPQGLEKAVHEYFTVDAELRHPSLLWLDEEFDTFDTLKTLSFVDESSRQAGDHVTELCRILERFCDSVSGHLGLYDPYEFTNSVGLSTTKGRHFKHGTGSVSDMRRGENKYSFPSWPPRLSSVFPYEAFGSHDLSATHHGNECQPSKLIAVPKVLSRPRLIASEPTCNQWCQQITRYWLLDRLEHTKLSAFIDLRDQSKSQRMVSKSSRDRELATVDLSSASDRLSLWVVERAFRKNRSLLAALQAHRTPFIKDATGVTDFCVPLKKFASQGTAVTFPVQTLIFLCCAAAALGCESLSDLHRSFRGKVRIYGDDIIIPRKGYDNLKILLDHLELEVNVDKTFSQGFFRESCGLDAYKGADVTPIKPQILNVTGPESLLALIDSSNNFFIKGYWRTGDYIARTIPPELYKFIPVEHISDLTSASFVSFVGDDMSMLPFRRNHDLCTIQRRRLHFTSSVEKESATDPSGFFQFIVENPSPDTDWCSGVVTANSLKQRVGWVDSWKDCVLYRA